MDSLLLSRNAVPTPARPIFDDLVTSEQLHARTRALALIAGRIPPHVLQVDYEQAKRDLSAEAGDATKPPRALTKLS
ncbi:MAG: hypothetical protein ABW223_01665 [Rariglobus sp.]